MTNLSQVVYIMEEGENISSGELVFYFVGAFGTYKRAVEWITKYRPSLVMEEGSDCVFSNPNYEVYNGYSTWGIHIRKMKLL